MTNYTNRAEKRIDFEDVPLVAVDGGTVILARTYRATMFDVGEVPIAVSGVYSPTDLRNALTGLGFDHEHVEQALRCELRNENATHAVTVAERQAGNAEVLA